MLGEVGVHLRAEVEGRLVQSQAEHLLRVRGGECELDRAASGVTVEVEPRQSCTIRPAEQPGDLVGERVVGGRRRQRVQLELLRVSARLRAQLADESRVADCGRGDDPGQEDTDRPLVHPGKRLKPFHSRAGGDDRPWWWSSEEVAATHAFLTARKS